MNAAMPEQGIQGRLKELSIAGILQEYAAPAEGWHIEAPGQTGADWIRVRHERSRPAAQGWKLHVSAGIEHAAAVLRRAAPVLAAERVSFKVASSLSMLRSLNAGEGGFSQIGKFITVYPADDAQAVRLAAALHAATGGLSGPAVPSDRPLAPGSLVHYRFGGFSDQHVQTPLGAILPAIRKPDGSLVPDQRRPFYCPPDWVEDPFLAAGVATELPPKSPLIAERYLITSALHTSPRSTVFLAVDIETPRCCVIKQARRGVFMGDDGDAVDRLRHEATVLARLSPDPRFPALYDVVDHDGDTCLVMEDVEGATLERHVAATMLAGAYLSAEQVCGWGRELAALLETIHSRGLVYRDLKSSNIIVAPDAHLRLIDLELAQEQGAAASPFGRGTRGYMSPQQEAGAHAAVSDDVYGLGAILFFLATGAEPSVAPRADDLLARPLDALNPAIDATLAGVIARCLHPDPSSRYATARAVAEALAAVGGAALADQSRPQSDHAEADGVPLEIVVVPGSAGILPAGVPGADLPATGSSRAGRSGRDARAPTHVRRTEADARRRATLHARRLADTICAVAQPAPGGQGLAWVSTHMAGGGMRSRDLNTGGAGTLLALAELVGAFDEPWHREVLIAAARYLASGEHSASSLPGLYVGEAGPAAALLRAGQILGDRALVRQAVEAGRRIARAPFASPDLFNGTAGRLRLHLLLWDETGEPEHLEAARRAGESLLGAVTDAGDGAVFWTIPPGYDGLSGTASLGYAHGAAGIGDALLDLFAATRDTRFLDAALGAGRWLLRHAVPVLPDHSGLDWPVVEGGALTGGFWCHGAAGIGRFFLHAARTGAMPEALDTAMRAARAAAHGARRANATQCHGLSGNIEFLLDVYQATGDRAFLAEARSLQRLLEAFAREQDGNLVWPSEMPAVVSPDYMVGYAGVAVCLLRLAEPERRPHQLSSAGFRFDARRTGGDGR